MHPGAFVSHAGSVTTGVVSSVARAPGRGPQATAQAHATLTSPCLARHAIRTADCLDGAVVGFAGAKPTLGGTLT